MLTTLRAWLNGKREYFTGVALYDTLGNDAVLKSLFKKGQTNFSYERLQDELLKICEQLKKQNNGSNSSHPRTSVGMGTKATGNNQLQKPTKEKEKKSDVEIQQTSLGSSTCAATSEENSKPDTQNSQLYDACKKEADKKYKEVMNMRAELFALARMDDFTDVNMPDKVQAREKLAVAVVAGYQQVSKLYDRADYVKQHGRLPHDENSPLGDGGEENVDNIPDHLVKQTLDNLRKNYNKIKKREQTPERIALMQKHESTIKNLEARWNLLKAK